MKHGLYKMLLLSVMAAAAGLAEAATGPAPTSLLPPQDQAAAKTPGHIDWIPLPGQGKKVKLSEDYSFSYEFSQRPQMGTVILVIRVIDKNGDQVVPYKIVGRTDMPAMRGAHDSGDLEFKTNKANNYLLPVNVVMPGEWEVQVTFSMNAAPVYYGSIRFNV